MAVQSGRPTLAVWHRVGFSLRYFKSRNKAFPSRHLTNRAGGGLGSTLLRDSAGGEFHTHRNDGCQWSDHCQWYSQAAIGVEKTFVEGGTSSSSSSPLATTPSSGLVKSLVTALFGECEGISAVAVESGAAEGEEEKKARQTENNTAVRENDVLCGRVTNRTNYAHGCLWDNHL